jgi:hypothetical protein
MSFGSRQASESDNENAGSIWPAQNRATSCGKTGDKKIGAITFFLVDQGPNG